MTRMDALTVFIKDPGGVGLSTQASGNITSSVNASGGGGGSGGCMAGIRGSVDPLLALMLLLSVVRSCLLTVRNCGSLAVSLAWF